MFDLTTTPAVLLGFNLGTLYQPISYDLNNDMQSFKGLLKGNRRLIGFDVLHFQ